MASISKGKFEAIQPDPAAENYQNFSKDFYFFPKNKTLKRIRNNGFN